MTVLRQINQAPMLAQDLARADWIGGRACVLLWQVD